MVTCFPQRFMAPWCVYNAFMATTQSYVTLRIMTDARDRLRTLADLHGVSMANVVDMLSHASADDLLMLHARRTAEGVKREKAGR